MGRPQVHYGTRVQNSDSPPKHLVTKHSVPKILRCGVSLCSRHGRGSSYNTRGTQLWRCPMKNPLDEAEAIALTVSRAAKLVCRTPVLLYREIRAGRLLAYRPHPKADLLIFPDDLRTWVRGKSSGAKGTGASPSGPFRRSRSGNSNAQMQEGEPRGR